ncbi:MAG: hypothetical protein JWO74_3780, partial [Solirubrobacterales bacterium]|nr:hypothetical protein [Solirubrobacterales bacterium]
MTQCPRMRVLFLSLSCACLL